MRPPFAILDFPPSPARAAGSLLFENPTQILEALTLDDVPALLRNVDEQVALGRHAVGFVSYEAAPAFDPALVALAAGPVPLAWFAFFDAAVALARTQRASAPSAAWHHRSDAVQYARAVETIRDAIGRGDVYQVNHTIRLDVDVDGDTDALHQRLLAAQGPGFGAHIHTGRFEFLSASPELFIERRGDVIETRPMKGTARRGRWLEEDDRRAAALAASDKERAENVMIVDLIRNDLGRIAVPGSVRVTRLFDVERRPTVLQMTSTATARLRPNTTTWDAFAALFPCGSVTGAPKIMATRMIAALEEGPRGVYCGAIGHIAPGGDATFSVAIRTLTIDHHTGRAEYSVGSGITWDSAEAAEYDEVVAKAAILTADLPAFELLETLRLEHGTYARLERHLTRLEKSAQYFGFSCASTIRPLAQRALADHTHARAVMERVRLRASPAGVVTIEASPMPGREPAPPRFALATSPVKRNNRFLFHKTTHRAVYDRHRAEHPDAFDVLLWNEDGEVTEFTIGNVVVELDGQRLTPPRDCGLLAGTFREELLEKGEIEERVILIPELRTATRVWLVNSLREWVEVNYSV